ncbi:MAG TPA: hypothetical protein VGB13_06635, partial [Candidatus Krumholzibacteria bacterium]
GRGSGETRLSVRRSRPRESQQEEVRMRRPQSQGAEEAKEMEAMTTDRTDLDEAEQHWRESLLHANGVGNLRNAVASILAHLRASPSPPPVEGKGCGTCGSPCVKCGTMQGVSLHIFDGECYCDACSSPEPSEAARPEGAVQGARAGLALENQPENATDLGKCNQSQILQPAAGLEAAKAPLPPASAEQGGRLCPHGQPWIDNDDNAMSCGCCGKRGEGGRCRACPTPASAEQDDEPLDPFHPGAKFASERQSPEWLAIDFSERAEKLFSDLGMVEAGIGHAEIDTLADALQAAWTEGCRSAGQRPLKP